MYLCLKRSQRAAMLLVLTAVGGTALSGCSSASKSAAQTTATVTVTADPSAATTSSSVRETTTTTTTTSASSVSTASTSVTPKSSSAPSRTSTVSQSPTAKPSTTSAADAPEVPETISSSVKAPPASSSNFDKVWAKKTAGWIVEDIKTIDSRIPNGGDIGLAYSNLSNSYGYLEEAGVPPGADAASYLARLRTAKNFASDAFTIESDDQSGALAKYLAVRGNTQPILDAVNAAVGTKFSLPPAPAT